MKRRIMVLACVCAICYLVTDSIAYDQEIVDGLVQNSSYLFMEQKEYYADPEWNSDEDTWGSPIAEVYMPVRGIAINEENNRQNKEMISNLSADIEDAFFQYNPDIEYNLDDAYMDSITESLEIPGTYRVAIIVSTETSIERLEF